MKAVDRHRLALIRVLRRLPPGTRGKARLARFILGPLRHTRDVLVTDRYGCRFLVPSVSEPIGFHLLVDGVYEHEALSFILSRLRPGGIFLDVGASIGSFSLPAARKVGPAGRVISIEASPLSFSYLQRNVTQNAASNVYLERRAAAGTSSEVRPFYQAPVHHFGMSSFAPQFDNVPIDVPTCTVDEVLRARSIDRVDILKVDVEGFEDTVFRGATGVLSGPRPPVVIFEFCDWAEERNPTTSRGGAQRTLRDFGYQLWRLLDFQRAGRQPLAQPITSGFEMLVGVRP